MKTPYDTDYVEGLKSLMGERSISGKSMRQPQPNTNPLQPEEDHHTDPEELFSLLNDDSIYE